MKIRDNRDKNWFWMDNEYLNGYAKHLGVSCTAVYLSLCRFANNESQKCFPSMDLIADQNGITRRTVITAIQRLEEWGIVNVERSRGADGKNVNNVYTLMAKELWKDKPCEIDSLGYHVKIKTEPCENKDQTHVKLFHTNYTNINYTNTNNTLGNVDQEKLTSKEKDEFNKRLAVAEQGRLFEVFWKEYPNHTKKKDALLKWLKLDLKDGLFEKIMQSVRDSKESRQWKEGFIPHPTTWINGERWNDELKKENNKITKLIV